MAEGKFKELFSFFQNSGDATVNGTVQYHTSGKTTWTFGRSEACDFVYSAPKISRLHFQIELIDTHYYVEDMDSTNGTYLNGRKIEHKERLFAGDVISMGSVDIVFTKDLLF